MRDEQTSTEPLKLTGPNDHHQYVALRRGPFEAPHVLVGATTPLSAPGSVATLFMVRMSLSAARSYATAILGTCALADAEQQEANAQTKQ